MRAVRCAGRVRARGTLEVVISDAMTDRVLARQHLRNLVTLAGRNLIRDALAGSAFTPPSRFALGTSNTAVNASQTTLGAEVWRAAFTNKTTSSATVEITYFLTSTTANGNTLREAGIFNADAAGDMYARVVLGTPIVKTPAIAVLFVWTLSWSAN